MKDIFSSKGMLFFLIIIFVFISFFAIIALDKDLTTTTDKERAGMIPSYLEVNGLKFYRTPSLLETPAGLMESGLYANNMKILINRKEQALVYLYLKGHQGKDDDTRVLVYAQKDDSRYFSQSEATIPNVAIPENKVTVAYSRDIAESWIRRESPIFIHDGEQLTFVNFSKLDCDKCWIFKFWFTSTMTSGIPYPDSTIADTWHKIEITVEKGRISSAIIDDEIDELNNPMPKSIVEFEENYVIKTVTGDFDWK